MPFFPTQPKRGRNDYLEVCPRLKTRIKYQDSIESTVTTENRKSDTAGQKNTFKVRKQVTSKCKGVRKGRI